MRPGLIAVVALIASAAAINGAQAAPKQSDAKYRWCVVYGTDVGDGQRHCYFHRLSECRKAITGADGVFGVPTFVLDGDLFWGEDATDMFADCATSRACGAGRSATTAPCARRRFRRRWPWSLLPRGRGRCGARNKAHGPWVRAVGLKRHVYLPSLRR